MTTKNYATIEDLQRAIRVKTSMLVGPRPNSLAETFPKPSISTRLDAFMDQLRTLDVPKSPRSNSSQTSETNDGDEEEQDDDDDDEDGDDDDEDDPDFWSYNAESETTGLDEEGDDDEYEDEDEEYSEEEYEEEELTTEQSDSFKEEEDSSYDDSGNDEESDDEEKDENEKPKKATTTRRSTKLSVDNGSTPKTSNVTVTVKFSNETRNQQQLASKPLSRNMSSKQSFSPNKSAKRILLPSCKSQLMPVLKKDRRVEFSLEEIQKKLAEETSGNIRALERHVMAIDLQLFPAIKNAASCPYSIRVSQRSLLPNNPNPTPAVVVPNIKVTPTFLSSATPSHVSQTPAIISQKGNANAKNEKGSESAEERGGPKEDRPLVPWRTPSCNLSSRRSFNKSTLAPSTTILADAFYQRIRANAIRHSVPPPRGVSLSALTSLTKSSRTTPAFGRHAIISAARLSSSGLSVNSKHMSAPNPGEFSEKRQLMRMMVTQELLSTERDYINDLILTTEMFYLPLRERQLVKERHIETLFSNMTMLLGLNTEMLEALENTTEIGQVFCTMFDFLKMYSIYCNNLPEAFKALDVLRKKFPRFEAFLQEQISNPQLRSLPLDGYLIKPIQRIMKYPLLIKELKKYTDTTNSDYKKLDKAESKIQSILETINENKRKYEEYEEVKLLQKRIVTGEKNELTRSEKIELHDKVRESFVEDELERNPGSRVAHYYLLNNALCRCVKKKGLLKSNRNLRLIAFIPLLAIRDLVDTSDKGGPSRSTFEFSYDVNGRNIHLTVQMSSSLKKQEMLKFLRKPHRQNVSHTFSPN